MTKEIEARKFHVIREGTGAWEWINGADNDKEIAENSAVNQYVSLENRGRSGERFFKPVEYGTVEGFVMTADAWLKANEEGQFSINRDSSYFTGDFDRLSLWEDGKERYVLIPTHWNLYPELDFETEIIDYHDAWKLYADILEEEEKHE